MNECNAETLLPLLEVNWPITTIRQTNKPISSHCFRSVKDYYNYYGLKFWKEICEYISHDFRSIPYLTFPPGPSLTMRSYNLVRSTGKEVLPTEVIQSYSKGACKSKWTLGNPNRKNRKLNPLCPWTQTKSTSKVYATIGRPA